MRRSIALILTAYLTTTSPLSFVILALAHGVSEEAACETAPSERDQSSLAGRKLITFEVYQKFCELIRTKTFFKVSDTERDEILKLALGEKRQLKLNAGKAAQEEYEAAVYALVDELNKKQTRNPEDVGPYFELMYEKESRLLKERIGEVMGVGVGMLIDPYGPSNKADLDVLPEVKEIVLIDSYMAGLRVGDKILKVDGVDSRKLMHANKLIDTIRGPAGSETTLTVVRADKIQHELTLTRMNFSLPTVKLTRFDHSVAVIEIPTMTYTTSQEFANLAGILLKIPVKAIVLDLRHCNGGYQVASENILRHFAKKGALIHQDRDDSKRSVDPTRALSADTDGPLSDLKVLVLVSEKTFGSAEHLASYLQSYKNVVMGQKTKGVAKVRSYEPLHEHINFSFLRAILANPNGTLLDQYPLVPDVITDVDDKVLDKAVAMALGS